MQTRPYNTKDGLRVWLSRQEQRQLVDHYETDPRRQLAVLFGLHGLRSDEIRRVTPDHIRDLDVPGLELDRHKLKIPSGKTGERETPLGQDTATLARQHTNSLQLPKDTPLVDVETRTLRDWIGSARDELATATGEERWRYVGTHDLRRTWATDTYYSLAAAGVPIAETLTLGWGGWAMTAKGRETFRENYLGPEPDHIAADVMNHLPLV